MHWTKAPTDPKNPGERWICRVPPDARYTLVAFAKGDGRWNWEAYAADSSRPMATGIVGSFGAAKSVSVNFLKRAGQL